MTTSELKNLVRTECAKKNIKVVLSTKKNITSGSITCSGYFDPHEGVLKVACNNKIWKEILIHEYCHFLQWSKKRKFWDEMCNKGGIDPNYALDLWLDGQIELSIEQRERYKFMIMAIEIDCESMVVDFIRKHNIDIDIKKYIKSSNTYVMFYHAVFKYRKWYKKDMKPYNTKDIVDIMPETFNYDYMKISPKILKMYKEILS